jgi:MFS family permease
VAAFIGTFFMPFANGALVWVLMIVHGMFLDTFMSLTTTTLMESKDIKPEYFGTAIGVIFTMGLVGAVSGPPIGALFTNISGSAPFFFWAGLTFIALMIFSFVRLNRSNSRMLEVAS